MKKMLRKGLMEQSIENKYKNKLNKIIIVANIFV